MKIGFIGCGNMATAIVKGIVSSSVALGSDINVFDINVSAYENLVSAYGCNKINSAKETAKRSDILFLAVKPNVIASVLEEIDFEAANNNCLLISIAAGKTIDFIESKLNNEHRIVRVMPNINAMVGEAISGYCTNKNVSKDDCTIVEKLLNSFGKSLKLDETYFPVFGVIGGCSPAFAYMFIDALARAGVKNGMKKDDALKIAAQAVYGSAKMILETDEHPYKLIDNVCSPGGTTIEGVTSLQADNFESAVHNAVNKAIEKDKML